MKQLLLKELDTMQVAKNDKDIMYTHKLELLKKLKLELQRINKDMDIGDEEFIECENDLWIALIVTQQQIEEQISQLKG
ncbi:TPA: hypothetical protein ACGXMH_002926 [Bacillus mobilis]|nr:hypothetical protein [Bacillus mobilis]MED4384483.1 hypothetical protein [Bacillus mobilis]HDX9641096.1 hypothetical protein [Bacillus mobilis]